MDADALNKDRAALISQHGDWTAHNVYLADGLYTYDAKDPRFQSHLENHGVRLSRFVQIAADLTRKPFDQMRVLDLGCLEGLYAIEFARRGAHAVGVEAREANLAKARFVKEKLGLERLQLELDDVRNLSVEKYGTFDVVLCLGLLYHLDAPDVFRFVEQMASVCTGVTIIDTHVATEEEISREYLGRTYYGRNFKEHDVGAGAVKKMSSLWASLDNDNSFWPTRPSLYNLLADSGFTSAYSCHNPAVPYQRYDRDTVVAVKGTRVDILSAPLQNSQPLPQWPRHSPSLSRPRLNIDGAVSAVKVQLQKLARKAKRS